MRNVIQFRLKALSGDATVSKTGERGSIPRPFNAEDRSRIILQAIFGERM